MSNPFDDIIPKLNKDLGLGSPGGRIRETLTPFSVPAPKTALFADTMYDRIVSAIKDFEAGLAVDEEIGAQLANFGNNITVAIEDIGYHNPFLILIHGVTSNGHRCTLLQHMSQANILLVALKAREGHGRRIGFKLQPDTGPKQEP